MSHLWIRRLFSRILPKATRARRGGRRAESIKKKWTAHNMSVEQLEDRLAPSITSVTSPAVHTTEGLTGYKIATFTDNDTAGGSRVSHLSATVNWGDGNTSANVSFTKTGATSYSLLGTHLYEEGTFTIPSFAINDDDGSSGSTAGGQSVYVADAQLTDTSGTLTVRVESLLHLELCG